MSGMGGVAQEDQLVIMPALADDPPELEPGSRTAQVRGIGEKRLSVEIFGEYSLAQFDRFCLIHPIEAQALPRLLRTFDDERRAIVGKAVGMGPDPAGFDLLEGEREGVKRLRGAQPDEAV